ncbi:MAG: amidohydrolase family protein [Candidatus Omnitrophota bacterium]
MVEKTTEIPVLDSHQHLGPEEPVVTDLCRLMVNDNYLATDLVSAGMDTTTMKCIADTSIPLSKRWDLLFPLWQKVKYGSYAQAELVTLRDLYGMDEMSGSKVIGVSKRLSHDFQTPGLFRRVLWKKCGIKVVLTQGGYFHHENPVFFNVSRPLDRADFSSGGTFEDDAHKVGVNIQTVDDLVPAMDALLRHHSSQGAVGFKIAALPWSEPSSRELKMAFSHREQKITNPYTTTNPLIRLYVSRIATLAEELNLTVAVHTGAPWTNWLDYRIWEPTSLIPLFSCFRNTRFDLYHAGIPYGTQASLLAKVFPNVWHNLTWAHIISPELAMRSIAEWLDLVPLNKVLGFGGDYTNETVILTYGHLMIARTNLCRVLSYRVKCGQMEEEDVLRVLKSWLYENPYQLYRMGR